MNQDPRRKLLRLHGFDYRTPALYHVVACTHARICRFGVVRNREMHLNDIGEMVNGVWLSIPKTFPSVEVDAWSVMPNHLHGVIFIEPPIDDLPIVALGDVMKLFKSQTTTRYGEGVRAGIWPPYDQQFWQRGYYDHVVRSDRDLDRIREYIANNPFNWAKDDLFA